LTSSSSPPFRIRTALLRDTFRGGKIILRRGLYLVEAVEITCLTKERHGSLMVHKPLISKQRLGCHRGDPLMNSILVHPLLDGVSAIGEKYRIISQRSGLFEELYERIRENWNRHRELDRWPTPDKNWVLRVAPKFTSHPINNREKQLQKQIAICLENEGWVTTFPRHQGLSMGVGGR
jgi:hypothetical protein